MARELWRVTAAGLTVILVIGLHQLAAGRAFAQPTDAAAAVAREEFGRGVEAARGDRWPEAYEAFRRAYAAVPRPNILLNLASAQAHTGRLLAATASYEQFLRDLAGDEGAAAHRAAARQGLDLVRARIPRLVIQARGAVEGDETRVDGDGVTSAAAAAGVEVDPGSHEVTLHRGGEVVGRVQVEVSEGERREVELVAIAPELPEEEQSLLEDDGEDGSTVWSSPWLWVGVGAVVAGALVAVLVLSAGGESDPISGNVGPGVVGVR